MNTNSTKIAEKREPANPLPPPSVPRAAVVRALSIGERALLTRRVAQPVHYVSHPDFAARGIEQRLFGGEAKLLHSTATRFIDDADPLRRVDTLIRCASELSGPQESLLFMRLNFARWRVGEIMAKHAGTSLSAAGTRHLLGWERRALRTRDTLVRLNMPLVKAMTQRILSPDVDPDEMISEGNITLMHCVDLFDCSRGFKFSTYACRSILRSFSSVASRTRRLRSRFLTVFDPKIERSDYQDTRRAEREEDGVDALKTILRGNGAALSRVERAVIRERFAIGDARRKRPKSPKTLEQVGRILGRSKEWVRQIQNGALEKLRMAMEDEYLAA